MSALLDRELKIVISKVGLHAPEINSWNSEITNQTLNKIKRTYIKNAEYSDIELIISEWGEEELKELQGLVEEKLEEVRRENP